MALSLDLREGTDVTLWVTPGRVAGLDVRVDVVPGGVVVVARSEQDLDWWLRSQLGETLAGDFLEESVAELMALAKLSDDDI